MSINDWMPEIEAASARYGVPLYLLKAVIQHESGGEPEPALAIGDNGTAFGLGQTHLVAAQAVGMESDWRALVDAIHSGDRETAARIGANLTAAYLAPLLKSFHDPAWALGAYNQGPGVIGRALAYADAVIALMPGASPS